MPSETGDMKVLGNFRKLIDQVSGDSNYTPSNPSLSKTALEAQYAAALASVENVTATSAPHRKAIGERVDAFESASSMVKRSRNLLKASGASKQVLDDAETVVRKILGRRKSPKAPPVTDVPDKPDTPENEAGANHSASQMSYDNRLGNLSGYLAILSSATSYKPNEDDLKVASLKNLATDLRAKNDGVSAAFIPLSRARGVRDNLLYLGADCVVNTAQLIKAYVSGANGTGSQLHKQIKGLQFKKAHGR